MEKKFKPYDKVLTMLRDSNWEVDFYSHYDKEVKKHRCVGSGWVSDNDILPYEGNEELVGTTDEPDEEEIKLSIDEPIIVFDEPFRFEEFDFEIKKFRKTDDRHVICTNGMIWSYVIRFSDFNPNDMEETKKHILCVKNGKIIRYKG